MGKPDVVLRDAPHALYRLRRHPPAVRSNGLLFVSGQVGALPDGSPEPDPERQIRLAFDNLDGVLAAAGLDFADVIDTTLFMIDPETIFETVARVMADRWGASPCPATTAMGVTRLAGFRFEIEVVARLRENAA